MNNSILNIENQLFIDNNLDTDVLKLLLKSNSKNNKDIKLLIEQIEAKKRAQKKLPTWFLAKNIYYPNKLNIEQTSSEITANYKANLVSGNSLIDLTGGFGVDCFYFAKHIKQVIHCEINEQLSQIVAHNNVLLNAKNITCFSENGLNVLKKHNNPYDWIYVDPSRRNDNKGKVFLLKDCLPNIPEHLDQLFKYSKNIMIKTSPLLDITSGINELKYVKAIHCVAVNNEVKELLWILEHNFTGDVEIKTVNLLKQECQSFNFTLKEEASVSTSFSEPLAYLYEPNAAILKGGAFNVLAQKKSLHKLHKHSHLYTSNKLISFPGRSFEIINVFEYNKKKFKRGYKNKKANVTTRNFPESVLEIRKKMNLDDGGKDYLFFTTNMCNKKIIIETKKA